MKVKNILEKLRLETLNYTFCLSDNDVKKLQQVSVNEDDWNNFAFSYIPSKLKKDFFKRLFDVENSEKVLNDFCEKYCYPSYEKLNSYNFERIKIKEFTRKVYDWIVISSDNNIKKEIILKNLINRKLINHKYFVFYLVYFFYNNRRYGETVFFIDYLLKKQIFVKDKDKLYNDLILYKLISLKENNSSSYGYINNKKIFEEICDTARQLEDFSYVKIITLLECALEKNNSKEFIKLIKNKLNQINNFTLLDILNIYELAIYMKNEKMIKIVREIILNKDINLLDERYPEYLIFNFLEAIRLKDKAQIEKFKHLLKKQINFFSFEHYNKYYLNR